jgi:hypothetical protein
MVFSQTQPVLSQTKHAMSYKISGRKLYCDPLMMPLGGAVTKVSRGWHTVKLLHEAAIDDG